MERALALEGKSPVDDLRQGRLDSTGRAAVGAAAHRLREVPLLLRPLLDESFAEVRDALDIVPPRSLLVVDSLQLTPAPRPAHRMEERVALAVRALKALAVDRDVAVLAIYREEMYHPGQGVEGATELIVAKNRNGPTGFVDLYFYPRWLRFEDMLDPSG